MTKKQKMRVVVEATWTDGDARYYTNDKRFIRKALKRQLNTMDELISFAHQLDEEDELKQDEKEIRKFIKKGQK